MIIGEKRNRDIKPDAQPFDEVRIITVPRYKESGLSGDEWRISAEVTFYRNGQPLLTEGHLRNIETACSALPWLLMKAEDDGHAYYAGEGDYCDQEGCSRMATVTYRKKFGYCREGHKSELLTETIRRFCDKHKTRGDCGLDDADTNYEVI